MDNWRQSLTPAIPNLIDDLFWIALRLHAHWYNMEALRAEQTEVIIDFVAVRANEGRCQWNKGIRGHIQGSKFTYVSR